MKATLRLVESLANRLLTVDEIAVASRIEWLVERGKIKKAKSLIQDIFPKYCDVRGGIPFTFWPEDVYRTFYYLDNPRAFLTDSSFIIHFMGAHLEGLLKWFPGAHRKLADNETLNMYLRGYATKTKLVYRETRDIEEILNKIFGVQRNIHEELERNRKEIANKLSVEHEKAAFTIASLEQVSQEIALIERVSEEREKIVSLNLGYKNDLEKYRVEAKIAERLKNLIVSSWKSDFSSFLERIGNRVNGYLECINVRMGLKITKDEIKVKFEGGETDIHALSGGESGLLNLIVRIAILQELGQKSFLILEDPIMCFGTKGTSELFSLLNLVKNDFSHIIITTHRENLSLEADNKTTLEFTTRV